MFFIDFMREEMNEHPFGHTFKGDVNSFIKSIFPSMGFAKWLNTLRGQKLTPQETSLLVDAYIKYGDRVPADIPPILGLIARQYNIDFEIPSDWYQIEHWQEKYNKQA